MTDSERTVAVVGGGLAAHTAARRLQKSGINVVLVRRSTGGVTALWGGLGLAFGPFTDPPPDSAGAVESRQHSSGSFRAARRQRWTRLMERRGDFHPYRRLGLGFADVDDGLVDGLRLIDTNLLTVCSDATRLPGPYGGPAAPDVVASSVAPIDLKGLSRLGVFACSGLSGWRADSLAYQFDRIDPLMAVVIDSPAFGELTGRHPASFGRQFQRRFREDRQAVIGQLRDAIADSGVEFALFPPCLGADPDQHLQIVEALREALPVPVAEMPAARDSIHGWRLSRALQDSETAFSRIINARPRSLVADGEEESRVTAVQCGDDQIVEVDAVILATGRWIDKGLTGSAPLIEPLTGVPLWLDGAPVRGFEEAYPPDLLNRRPWDDHRLFRAGVSVDAEGRPRDRDGHARYQNVYAAGRMLGGFNPAHDGCAFGVELLSASSVADRVRQRLESPVLAASRPS